MSLFANSFVVAVDIAVGDELRRFGCVEAHNRVRRANAVAESDAGVRAVVDIAERSATRQRWRDGLFGDTTQSRHEGRRREAAVYQWLRQPQRSDAQQRRWRRSERQPAKGDRHRLHIDGRSTQEQRRRVSREFACTPATATAAAVATAAADTEAIAHRGASSVAGRRRAGQNGRIVAESRREIATACCVAGCDDRARVRLSRRFPVQCSFS